MKHTHATPVRLPAIILYLAPAIAFAGSTTSVPLKEAVASFNEKAATRFSEIETRGSPTVWAADRRPAPLTEEEIVAAIRDWNREEIKVDDKTYGIYQRIADSKALPPGAQLSFSNYWYRYDDHDEYEFLVWWIKLDVMTSKNTGYTFRIRDERLDRRRALTPSPGYAWIVNPYSLTGPWPTRGAGWSAGGVVFLIEQDNEGAFVVTAAWLLGQNMTDLRAVAFDDKATRYMLAQRGIGTHSNGSASLVMKRFRLDPSELPASKVRQVGLEAVDRKGLAVSSEAAVQRAREKRIEVLPLPQVGQPYEFRLTATDGRVIDSRRLRGKVLLIDCWASWCGPCMAMMPEMKEIYRRWHAKGLEIVGLNFDQTVKAAETAVEAHKIPWPIVIVPSDKEIRQLWTEAARINTLPRILLIDQQGVLRSDLSPPWELKEEIAALLQTSSAEADGPAQP